MSSADFLSMIADDMVKSGAPAGHEFYGNQWTAGTAVKFKEPADEHERTHKMHVVEDRGDRVLVQHNEGFEHMSIKPQSVHLKSDLVKSADAAGHPYRGNQHDEAQDSTMHATAQMSEHEAIRHNQQISDPHQYMAHTASIAAYQASKDIQAGKVVHAEAAAAHDVAAKLHRALGNGEYADKHERNAGYHRNK